ncbi:MAG: hypothetical protein GC159_24170 [Phycisphaera sp.]|nr:hypothetical protein [Phycisphaera sp.]
MATKKTTKKTSTKKAATRANMRAVHPRSKADQENARLAEQRANSPDGMTASERAMATSAKPAKKATTKKAPAKKASGAKAKTKMSGLDAVAKVLGETGEPMNTKAMVDSAIAKGYWKTGGKTPAATIYAAILREINTKGADARFKKVARGKFVLSAAGTSGREG